MRRSRRPLRGSRRPRLALLIIGFALAVALLAGCGDASDPAGTAPYTPLRPTPPFDTNPIDLPTTVQPQRIGPPLLNPNNVYAADAAGHLSPVVRAFPPRIYVPNSGGNTVTEINPATYKVIRQFNVGLVPQHVVPAYDLRTLWVTNDEGNSLTPIDPATGLPGLPVPVADPYNLYFTPDGRYAVVMAESLRRIDFLNAQTMRVHYDLSVPQCDGANHADFTANGVYMLVSCEFGAAMIVVDIATERVVRFLRLPPGSAPQDVKLAPDARIFYVADLTHGGVWEIDAHTFRRVGFIRTGAGAHGEYPSRNARFLYVSNRSAGTVSVISFATNRVVATWSIPGGSPDMGNVSTNGRVLWLSGRYDDQVYAINTRTGKLLARIPVGFAPHGLCVYPLPGRYSLGHTGIMR